MAHIQKSKLPEIHIDIGSHNANPASEEARELAMFIENDGDLYRGQTSAIIDNLAKKFAKGKYDHEQAKKLWKYLADSGAKKYTFEFGNPGAAHNWQSVAGFGTFTPAMRREAAAILANVYLKNINGDNPLVKRQVNPAPRKGTSKPRRVSQITKKAPSKRLVQRRLANSEPGYFPNPVNPPIPERKITNFMVIMYRAIDVASQRTGYKIERQARLSYAQGLVTAALELGLLRSDERDEIMESLKDALRIK